MTNILTFTGAHSRAAVPAHAAAPVRARSSGTEAKASKTARAAGTAGPKWPSSAARTWAQNIRDKDFVSVGPALDDGSESIQFTLDGAAKARKLIAMFGFSRLPSTAAELQQALGYCHALASTMPHRVGRFTQEQLQANTEAHVGGRKWAEEWVKSHWPAAQPAVGLFAAREVAGLLELHARLDLMTKFGTRYEKPYRASVEPKKRALQSVGKKSRDKAGTADDGLNLLERAEAQVIPSEFNMDMSEVTRLTAYSAAANGDNSDPVIYSAAVEVNLRRMVTKYAFDRLPLTYGELRAMMEYCLTLHSSRAGNVAQWPEIQEIARRVEVQVAAEYSPELVPALLLYQSGDMVGLLKLHSTERTLERIGKAYREFDRDDE